MLKNLRSDPSLEQNILDYALDCVQPGLKTVFLGELQSVVNSFKALAKVVDLHPNTTTITNLKGISFSSR